jgi:hypothetical protein
MLSVVFDSVMRVVSSALGGCWAVTFRGEAGQGLKPWQLAAGFGDSLEPQ